MAAADGQDDTVARLLQRRAIQVDSNGTISHVERQAISDRDDRILRQNDGVTIFRQVECTLNSRLIRPRCEGDNCPGHYFDPDC